MKHFLLPIIVLSIVGFTAIKTFAHCEIPCGIYNDELRIALLYEHFTTIEKAMTKIIELSEGSGADYMMIARWTMAKEEHAKNCLLYTSPSPRDRTRSRMPSSA